MSDIRSVQLRELEILKVFQDICSRHGLRYFAIGGTCLGAVRHKGFIPWDDDVDVAMPYEDYAKFKAIARTELPSYYAMHEHDKARHAAADYYFNLYDKRTTFIFNEVLGKRPDEYIGVYIDVFPVHGLPADPEERKKACSLSLLYLKLNRKLRMSFSEMTSLRGRVAWLALLPLRLFLPYNYFAVKHESMAVKYPFGCSDRIIFPWTGYTNGNSNHPEGWYNNVFPYEYFAETTELPFEDTTIRVPIGYKEFLTMEFGDYMKLPPEDKRVSHDGAFTDLERPYTYYVEHPEALPH